VRKEMGWKKYKIGVLGRMKELKYISDYYCYKKIIVKKYYYFSLNPSQSMSSSPIKTVKDLKVYNESFRLAMEVFHLTKEFPWEEQYSLTDQIRRSSRSVTANIREGYAKRRYEQVFIKQLVDAYGSSEETRTWLEFSVNSTYISQEAFERLDMEFDQLGGMLNRLINNWHKIE
jgi:four helix bundle protein